MSVYDESLMYDLTVMAHNTSLIKGFILRISLNLYNSDEFYYFFNFEHLNPTFWKFIANLAKNANRPLSFNFLQNLKQSDNSIYAKKIGRHVTYHN